MMNCSMRHLGCHHAGWVWEREMTCLWDKGSIQLFVLLGLIFQIVLAVLGSRRKTSNGETIRIVIWASYLLTSYFAMLALSKLTTVKSDNEHDTELKALLAPLILLLLGNPDSITAYSVEDNRLGLRRVLNLIITFSFVVWILGRNWKTNISLILYFPLFVAGIIKYGETIWALSSVYDQNTNMREEDFEEEKETYYALTSFHQDVPGLEIFSRAYYRFDCLKPHLVDWLKHPLFMEHRNKLIDRYSHEDVFLTTDMELGFMYDVLYTKAPVLYTNTGITLRVIGYFSLLVTSGGFLGLSFDKRWTCLYVIYTFGLLIGVVLLETYQLLRLFYSDWVIIRYYKLFKNPMVFKFLKLLVKRSLKKKRWSYTIRQFEFLNFCLSKKLPWPFKIGILRLFGITEKFKKYLAPSSVRIPLYLKELLLEDMKKFETKRGHRPFTKRGEWTLSIQGHRNHESLDKLKWSIEMTFDRSIIIWHIATHICDYSCYEDSNDNKASKLLSDYMMFLLVRHPHILSVTTATITWDNTYMKFKKFLDKITAEPHDRENILNILSGPEYVQESYSEVFLEPVITRGWDVVAEAQRLATELKSTKDTWELIRSVRVEMLCFAAYNCQQYHHAKLLRRGREIITHVWLLLSHKTDKFNTGKYTDGNRELE